MCTFMVVKGFTLGHVGDFDRKLSALEILISRNFMLCKYLLFNEVCTGILDGIMMINMLPYA